DVCSSDLLAAIGGPGHRNAQDVEEVLVGGIDADLAKVHRTRVDAVDPGPRIAAVGGFVDPAVLEAIGALSILRVFNLAAECGSERLVGVAVDTAPAAAATAWTAGRPLSDGQPGLHVFAIASEFDFQLGADIVIAVLF